MNVIAVNGDNARWNARAETFARSSLIELIGRLYLDVFHQARLIFPNIDFKMKLISSLNDFLCNLAAPCQGAQQEHYQLVI